MGCGIAGGATDTTSQGGGRCFVTVCQFADPGLTPGNDAWLRNIYGVGELSI